MLFILLLFWHNSIDCLDINMKSESVSASMNTVVEIDILLIMFRVREAIAIYTSSIIFSRDSIHSEPNAQLAMLNPIMNVLMNSEIVFWNVSI